MATMSQAHEVQQRLDEVKALRERLGTGRWQEEDWGLLERVLGSYERLLSMLCEAQITLKRLQTLVFGKRRQRRHGVASGTSASGGATGGCDHESGADARPQPGVETAGDEVQLPRAGGHRPGYGRLGMATYAGAERAECRHEALAVGQRCPVCGQGRLYGVPPGIEIRIDGNALLSAIRYELEKLRCSACGQMFTAPLPAEAGTEKYSPRARAVLAVSRYYLGLPFFRVEAYQAMLGVPVPDATQWDQIEQLGDCSYKVFAYLETLAAQGELIHQDDTSVRILSLMAENRTHQTAAEALGCARSQERTGMFTTALVVKVGEQTICLYYSSRSHAGENLQALLEQREAERDKPLVMSDALSRNEVDETTVIRCHCLAHGRRQFSDLADVFPVECQVVLDTLKQVFDHDEEARDKQMSPEARFAYHQA